VFEWSDLRYFLAIHRGGSLSAAARELRVNQTTAGRRLAQLEESLGTKLFDRMPDGFALTTAGRELLPSAERVESEALSVERFTKGRDRRPEGVVRVTTTELMGSRYFAPRLAGLRESHPGLRLEILTAFRALNLARHEADIAVRILPTTHASLVVRRIGEFAYALYAGRRYIERRGAPRTVDEVPRHTLFGYDESLIATPEAEWMEQARGSTPLTLRSNSSNTLIAGVREGMGVALLPCFAADMEPELSRVLDGQPVLCRTIWLVVHQDLARVPRMRAVASYLAAMVSRDQGMLLGKPP
jgi:DNA-binding transcriptional LysR family regulator